MNIDHPKLPAQYLARPSVDSSVSNAFTFVAVLLFLAAVVLFSVRELNSLSFEMNLDEHATWWIIKRGFIEALVDTTPFPPHSSYYGIAWFLHNFISPGLLFLRFLSLVSAVGACIFFGRFLANLFRVPIKDPAIVMAIAMFTFDPRVIRYASEIRPYTFALCLAFYGLNAMFEERFFSATRSIFIGVVLGLACLAAPVFTISFGCLFIGTNLYPTALGDFAARARTPLIYASLTSIFLCSAYFSGLFEVGSRLSSAYPELPSEGWVLYLNQFIKWNFSAVAIFIIAITRSLRTQDVSATVRSKLILAGLVLGVIPALSLVLLSFLSGHYHGELRYSILDASLLPLGVAWISVLPNTKWRGLAVLMAVLAFIQSYSNVYGELVNKKPSGWENLRQQIIRVSRHTERPAVLFSAHHIESYDSRWNLSPKHRSAWEAPLENEGIKDLAMTQLVMISADRQSLHKDVVQWLQRITRARQPLFLVCYEGCHPQIRNLAEQLAELVQPQYQVCPSFASEERGVSYYLFMPTTYQCSSD